MTKIEIWNMMCKLLIKMIWFVLHFIVLFSGSLCIVNWETVNVREIQSSIKSGHKCESIIKEFSNRILAYNKNKPGINAVLSLNPLAFEEARELDFHYSTNGYKGPLHCAPALIKDNIDVCLRTSEILYLFTIFTNKTNF